MNDLLIICFIAGAFVAVSLIVRLFNKLSGFAKLKTERDALQREKFLFEQSRTAFQSLRSSEEQKLNERANRLDAMEESILRRNIELRDREHNLNEQVRIKTIQLAKSIASREYLSTTPVFSAFASNSFSYDRLLSSLTSDMQISSPFDISATIRSGDTAYKTSLYHCDCPDYSFRHLPCKHMMRLGLEVGMLVGLDVQSLKEESALLAKDLQLNAREKADIANRRGLLNRLEHTQDQTYPWLAELRADAYEAADAQWVDYLKSKNRPAMQKAAEVDNIIHGELRQARIDAKQAEYQVHFYESLFPWLLDYKELPPVEAFSYVQNDSDAPPEGDAAVANQYLSPQEWAELSDTKRYQLILDRYIARSKTNWEIGIEYERYIGYLCEQRGYSVTYNGARAKLEDMGRDLILRRGNDVILVQCKRWASEKFVHENHVFQLAGSVFEYQYQHPQQSVSGALVTSTSLSEIAERCAGYLGIRVFSGVPFQEYPRIKCNIGRDGSKIYHLPVDQQYDTAIIDNDGEFYASTVAEAEAAGFRRAYRWHGNNGAAQKG